MSAAHGSGGWPMELLLKFWVWLGVQWDAVTSDPKVLWDGAGFAFCAGFFYVARWAYNKTEFHKLRQEKRAEAIEERTRRLWLEALDAKYKQLLYHHIGARQAINLDKSLVTKVPSSQRCWVSKQNPAPVSLDEEQSLLEVLEHASVGKSLLILGEPGAGKTTSLIQLALDLLEKARQDAAAPLPLLFHCSSWQQGQNIVAWLVGQLKEEHGIRDEQKYVNMLENGEIFPLLDGLDELPGPRRRQFLEQINAFIEPRRGLAMCSRREEYHLIGETAQVGGVVTLEPISPAKIERFLADLGRGDLYQRLRREEQLGRLAQRPLFLGLILEAEQSLPRAGLSGELSGPEYEALLWERYLGQRLAEAAADRDPKDKQRPGPWSATPNRTWLAWLAAAVKRHTGKTEFRLEEMQPTWLARVSLFHAARGLFVAALFFTGFAVFLCQFLGLAKGLACALLAGLAFAAEDFLHLLHLRQGLAPRLLHALAFGLAFGMWIYLLGGPAAGAAMGLGLFVISLVVVDGIADPEIEYTERMNLELKKVFSREFGKALAEGLVLGIAFGGALAGLDWLLISQILGEDATMPALATGVLGVLLFMLQAATEGLRADIQLQTKPGQGMGNSLRWGVGLTLCIVLLFLASMGVAKGPALALAAAPAALAFGLWVSPAFACIEHFILRCCLRRENAAPWRYVTFLNRMHQARLLQLVGGGYRFVHVNLREHLILYPSPEALSPLVRRALGQGSSQA